MEYTEHIEGTKGGEDNENAPYVTCIIKYFQHNVTVLARVRGLNGIVLVNPTTKSSKRASVQILAIKVYEIVRLR